MGKEYEEIKAEISVRISTEDIDDIVTTALEGRVTRSSHPGIRLH